jgi:D-tyrosyl-tRNA(Tyr) deacylase
MKAILQRVTHSSVSVDGEVVGKIGVGFMILLGVGKEDTRDDADLLAKKIANLRVFEDEQGKMNKSILDINGSCLVISQFTLFADCKHGRRPSFFDAGSPDIANELYEYFTEKLTDCGVNGVEKGVFGADMKVELLNDGPVTITLDTKEL